MDLRKLKDKATEAFAKGKFGKAAELYEEYCGADPKDLQARLRMGDAFAKSGSKEKAIAAYKSAAEGFAREGFLPRAIAASKLILELDPMHQGVQHVLADLYAKRGGGSDPRAVRKPATDAKPQPQQRREAIDLPPDDGSAIPFDVGVTGQRAEPKPASPPSAPAKAAAPPAPADAGVEIEVDDGSSSGGLDVSVDEPNRDAAREIDVSNELPPELRIVPPSPPPPRAAEPPEVVIEEADDEPAEAVEIEGAISVEPNKPAVPALAVAPVPAGGPPGLKPRRAAEPAPRALEPTPTAPAPRDEPIALTVKKTGADAAPGAPAIQSRIWIPGASPSSPAPAPVAESAPRKSMTDLEAGLAAFSKFDELDLDMAGDLSQPAIAAPKSAPPPQPAGGRPIGVPSFTELELEGDSLLHAVEMAASAGIAQRTGETVAPSHEEEMVLTPEEATSETAQPGALPKIPLFSDLPHDAFIELFERCPLRRAALNERIIDQGSVGDSFFVICAGSVRVVREDGGIRKELAVLPEGSFFGEMALLSGAPRSASVESASDDTQLLEISAPILTQLSLRYPQVAKALKKFCRQRLLQNVMGTSALFRPFNKKDRKALVERFRARDIQRWDVVIREGDKTDGLYVLLSGEVEVRKGTRPLARLKEGDIFGEMSLLNKTPATATVLATKRTSLLRLPREDFDAIILSHPQILQLVSELTEERQKKTAATLAVSGEVMV